MTGVIIVVSWALMYTAILRLMKYVDLGKVLRIGVSLALAGYLLDLVPGVNMLSPPLQMIGGMLVVIELGIAAARLRDVSAR